MNTYYILTINPGSTSTKIAIFENDKTFLEKTLRHSASELAQFEDIIGQFKFRLNIILDFLNKEGFKVKNLSAVVGRGGILKPIPSGTYEVNEQMLSDLKKEAKHASNLGAILAYEIAQLADIPAYIVDPVVVDELDEVARISGIPEFPRRSMFHALNQKAVGRKAARSLGKEYDECNLIIAHLGGGVSIGAHKKGRVVDVNNALDGDGPFSPERSGAVPIGSVVGKSFSGDISFEDLYKKIVGNGGIVAYLGTNDMRKVEQMVKDGDQQVSLVYEAMTYQVAKEIGACAAVLEGNVDAVVLTGGIAFSDMFVDKIKKRIAFIGPCLIFPGEEEMEALALGGLRVLQNKEKAKIYS